MAADLTYHQSNFEFTGDNNMTFVRYVLILCCSTLMANGVVFADDYKASAEAEEIYQRAYSLYFRMNNTEENKKEAVVLYQQAAELGHRIAQWRLYVFYDEGVELEEDVKKATYWLIKSADQGYLFAQNYAGLNYALGLNGVDVDHEKARRYLIPAAEGGHPIALTAMAAYYMLGEGVEQNIDLAVKLKKLADAIYADTSAIYALHLKVDRYVVSNLFSEGLIERIMHQFACQNNIIAEAFMFRQVDQENRYLWLKVSAYSGSPIAIYQYNKILASDKESDLNEITLAYELLLFHREKLFVFFQENDAVDGETNADSFVSKISKDVGIRLSETEKNQQKYVLLMVEYLISNDQSIYV
jgi:TPR repeat protein